MSDIKEVLREMWQKSQEGVVIPNDVYIWADAIEAAMREPVAEVGKTGIYSVASYYLPEGTPLFALPPDAAGEIERLKAENTRLRELVEFERDLEAALAGKVSHD